MNLCVYGASSNELDRSYETAVELLGREMARRGHALIFGAGGRGMMGAAARGAAAEGGYIVGIVPNFFNVDGILFDRCNELLRPATMRERKRMLEERSDAFIVTPGGIGTFDEFFEILTLRQLGRHTKAIVIYNVNHYYDPLLAFLKNGAEQKFMKDLTLDLFQVFEDAGEMLDYLESYVPQALRIEDLKGVTYQ